MPNATSAIPGGKGAAPTSDFRVIYHEPICPDCGSFDITSDEVQTGDGFTETAFTCRDCGTAWPLACVSDMAARP